MISLTPNVINVFDQNDASHHDRPIGHGHIKTKTKTTFKTS